MSDARITVVHLITGLGTGGAETMLRKLVTRMDRDGFRNVVVSMTDIGTIGPALEAAGITVAALGMRRGLPDPRGLLPLLRLLRAESPAILQTWLYHADLLGTFAARLAGVPRLAWNLRCANMDLRQYSQVSQMLPRILARLSRLPDAVLVNSLAGKAFHEGLGYRPRRWEFVANGFDLEVFRPDPQAGSRLRAALGLPNEAAVFGHVARFDPMKDHAGLLRAFARIVAARDEARLVMIGQGVDEANAALAREVAANGLTRHVSMLGPRQDVAALTAGFDVAVSSSTGEGFPNVIGEAMACGVPCLVTDAGDSALVVGHAGRVVPPGDAGAFATAAIDLIDMGECGRRQLGDAARARVATEFALPLVVQRYERLYRELAAPAARGIRRCAA
jgi:glycosyltransferase involved in cell wall biosynthesis